MTSGIKVSLTFLNLKHAFHLIILAHYITPLYVVSCLIATADHDTISNCHIKQGIVPVS